MVSKLVHNEQVKLMATYCNNIGVAAITVGGTIPLITHSPNYSESIVLGAILAAIAQFVGRMKLRWLKE
jgi:hypothetical protein